jgi:fluoroquinolone transport system ATP-binding protein
MIKVNNLFYTYPDAENPVIKDINFSLEKGEIFGFLGPSGAGKTTTQKILLGILKNYKGSIIFNGQEIRDSKPSFYENIGVMFEFPNFFTKLTGIENLNFFASLYSCKTAAPAELLKIVGLEENGDMQVENYSKGMKTRINFVRALLNNPDILFLDEPTTGLDPANQKNIKNIICQQKDKGKTIFLTTHNMTVADEVCDRVAFITEGEINLIDSPKKLKIENGQKKVKVEYFRGSELLSRSFKLNNIGNNEDFLELIKSNQIETIHSQEATLEDVFIHKTGKELR